MGDAYALKGRESLLKVFKISMTAEELVLE